MNKIRQILLFLERGYSLRAIEKEVKITRKTIALYLRKFTDSGLTFDELLKRSDKDLERLLGLFKPVSEEDNDPRKIKFNALTDYFTKELSRTGVTRLLLWNEYIKEQPDGFQYSRFCELLQINEKIKGAVMHFVHSPAKLLEVDFAGDLLHYVDCETGELVACPVYIAVLPFSGYGYVEALPNAKLPQVVKALNHTIEYFGGAPLTAKSDNMKQWVSKSCKYEPVFNEMIQEWANHNSIALLAARPFHPRDKASVENNVKIIYSRIYATLRDQTFHSLAELNKAIRERLEAHHQQNFQKKTYSRSELFVSQEKSLLQPLPESPYCIKHYTKAKVQKNYHVFLGEDNHYYSVPFRFISKETRIVYDQDNVEIYHENQRIAFHSRNYTSNGYSTITEHRPLNHQVIKAQGGWDAQYYLKRAQECGPNTFSYVEKVLASKPIIDHTYQICKALLSLMKSYGNIRMEAACKRGLRGCHYNSGVIRNILMNNRDLLIEEEEEEDNVFHIPSHNNIRGAEAYKSSNIQNPKI